MAEQEKSLPDQSKKEEADQNGAECVKICESEGKWSNTSEDMMKEADRSKKTTLLTQLAKMDLKQTLQQQLTARGTPDTTTRVLAFLEKAPLGDSSGSDTASSRNPLQSSDVPLLTVDNGSSNQEITYTGQDRSNKSFNGKVTISTAIAMFNQNEETPLTTKPVIVTMDSLSMKIMTYLSPNMIYNDERWHCMKVNAELTGRLDWNNKNGLTAVELVTKPTVKSMDGTIISCVTDKKRNFENGELDYICPLIMAEELEECQAKRLTIIIQFKLYPKNIESPMNMDYSDEEQVVMVTQPQHTLSD